MAEPHGARVAETAAPLPGHASMSARHRPLAAAASPRPPRRTRRRWRMHGGGPCNAAASGDAGEGPSAALTDDPRSPLDDRLRPLRDAPTRRRFFSEASTWREQFKCILRRTTNSSGATADTPSARAQPAPARRLASQRPRRNRRRRRKAAAPAAAAPARPSSAEAHGVRRRRWRERGALGAGSRAGRCRRWRRLLQRHPRFPRDCVPCAPSCGGTRRRTSPPTSPSAARHGKLIE